MTSANRAISLSLDPVAPGNSVHSCEHGALHFESLGVVSNFKQIRPAHVTSQGTRVCLDAVIDESPAAQTLRRGLAILRLLARAQAGLRVSDIGRRLGMAKATAVRLTQALASEGFVVHDAGTRGYRLGPEAFAIGLAAEPNYSIQRIAAPALTKLTAATGESTCFSVREGFEAICLSVEKGGESLPPGTLRVGDRYPLGVSSAGLAMLAALPDDEVQDALAANAKTIDRLYPRSPVHQIRQLVDETRKLGYALIPGLLLPGYWAVGVAVLQFDGRPLAAITLVASELRLHPTRCATLGERMRSLGREVSRAAQAVRDAS